MFVKFKQISLPIWQYLNQPLFRSTAVWKPARFWYYYKIELLKRCLSKESEPESHHHSQ